jgi:hypothetical protein
LPQSKGSEKLQKVLQQLKKNDGIDSFVIADFTCVGRISNKPWRIFQYLALPDIVCTSLNVLLEKNTYIK